MGDASNLVSIIAGELLQKAEHLLRMGLHPSDIVQGYEVASAKALEILEGTRHDILTIYRICCLELRFLTCDVSYIELSVEEIKSVQTKEDLFKAVRSSIAAKQYGNEDMLTDLVCEAAIAVMPKEASNFNVDNVRVVKIMGSSLYESRVVKGMVFGRSPEGKDLDQVSMKTGRRSKGLGLTTMPLCLYLTRCYHQRQEGQGCHFHLPS